MKLSFEEKKIICDFFELLLTKLESKAPEPILTKNDAQKDNQKNRLIPLSQWNNYHDWPSIAGLRNLVFHQDTNGFKKCIRRSGRRILINEEEFFEWIECNHQFERS